MSINLINYALAKKDWKKAYVDLKVLGVGGRNLLRNTGDFKDLTYWSLIKSTNQQGLVEIVDDSVRGKVLHVTKPNHDDSGWWVLLNSYYLYRPEKFIIGKEYTLSLDIKASVAMTVTINFRDNDRQNPVTRDLMQSISTPNTWNRYTFTFKATATGNKPQLYINIGSSIGELWLDNVKLEEGNKATDWTPAPEDIDAHPFVAELAETVFRSKQQDLEKAYEDLKVLGVGGRNLLRNSDFSQGTTWWFGISEIVDGYNGYKGAVLKRSGYSGSDRYFLSQDHSSGDLLTEGETYTLSGWFYIDSSIPLDSKNNSFFVRKYQSGTTGTYRDIINFPVTLDEFSYDTWYYFKATGTVPEGYNGRDSISFALGKNGRVIVSALKLEKGNKATDWTPAPEDINAHPFVAELAESVFRSKQNLEKSWEKAYEDLKVLGAGGRNLVGNFNLYPWGYGRSVIDDFGNTLSYVVKLERHTNYIVHRKTADYNNRFRLVFVDKDTDDPEDLVGEFGTVRFSDDNALSYSFNSEDYNWLVIYLTNQKDVDDIEKAFVKLEKGDKATDWTPAPEDINAHPFVAELAETVYRSKQNEERIRNLENAITALGGGS